jgi:hypothetical protein
VLRDRIVCRGSREPAVYRAAGVDVNSQEADRRRELGDVEHVHECVDTSEAISVAGPGPPWADMPSTAQCLNAPLCLIARRERCSGASPAFPSCLLHMAPVNRVTSSDNAWQSRASQAPKTVFRVFQSVAAPLRTPARSAPSKSVSRAPHPYAKSPSAELPVAARTGTARQQP